MTVSTSLDVETARADSANPDTNAKGSFGTGAGVQPLIGSTSTTECLFLKIRIPDRDTLTISNKAYIHKIRLSISVSVAGSSIFCYPMNSTFNSSIEFEELTYSTPNREGNSSNIKWNPANPVHIDPTHTVPICVGGDRFEDFLSGGTGTENLDITEIECKTQGYDFGSTIFLILYATGASVTSISNPNSSATLLTKEKKPDQATLASAITADGLSANLSVTLPNDDSIDKYYLESASSAGISATASEDFGQATPNLGATEVVPMSSVATLTQGANKFVRVFTENDEHFDTSATAGN